MLAKAIVIERDGKRCLRCGATRRGPTNHCATLRPLVEAAHRRVPIALVLADAEFDSERNHQHIRQILQAQSVIPTKRGGAEWHIKGVRAHMRQEFPVRLDRSRLSLRASPPWSNASCRPAPQVDLS